MFLSTGELPFDVHILNSASVTNRMHVSEQRTFAGFENIKNIKLLRILQYIMNVSARYDYVYKMNTLLGWCGDCDRWGVVNLTLLIFSSFLVLLMFCVAWHSSIQGIIFCNISTNFNCRKLILFYWNLGSLLCVIECESVIVIFSHWTQK